MKSRNLNVHSKKERIGFILLIVIIIAGITIWQILYHTSNDNFINQNISSELKKWDSFKMSQLIENDTSGEPVQYQNSYTSYNNYSPIESDLQSTVYNPQPFDPNTATIETMIASGVPIGSAKRIIKYRNKGGKFYDAEKLRNFGFSEEEYKKIIPYITIHKKERTSNYSNNKYENKPYIREPEPTSLPINTASAEDLMKFKGIGPGFSKRIIEYRNKLGGFIKIEQLKEIYGLPDSTYLHIKDKIVIEAAGIHKININTASEEQLMAHPYIGKYMASNIIKLRTDLKDFKNISDLRQVPLINEEKYRKIVPYIKI